MAYHEIWGHHLFIGEPSIIGTCDICHNEIYEGYEMFHCECDLVVCGECKVKCAYCGTEGCKGCMILDMATLEWFCNTASTSRIEDSECYQEWIKESEV